MKTTMLVAAAALSVRGAYQHSDTLGGPGRDFFSEFTYYTGGDQTHGYVNFQGQGTSLTQQDSSGVSYIRADTTQNSGGPRKAIKLYSKKKWNKGLFILDVNHIPGGVCGSWPAWWFNGEGARTWPATGEIDVLEYVHKDNYNQGTLHTAPGCYLRSQEGVEMEGRILHSDCGAGGGYTGCGSKSHDGRTAGDGFNNAGGGVYIVEFNFEQHWPIKMWSFVRNEIPADILNGQPNPASWKLPFAMFHINDNDCPNSTFDTQTMIFDQTFCGDWAGASGVWNGVGCAASTGYGSCNDYVRENGSAFEKSYFSINDIKIYQWDGTPAPPSPPPAPVPEACTAEGSDPYSSGSFVPCCGSETRKCLKQSAGWAYRCQSCSQSCPDEQDEFNARCGFSVSSVFNSAYLAGRPFTPLGAQGQQGSAQRPMSNDEMLQAIMDERMGRV